MFNQSLERGYFVLDENEGIIHMYKSLDDDAPLESLSLSGGIFLEKLSNQFT
jgi:hypothetical protein